MIHDKDFMMRQIKQFSEFIAAMLLGKNEGKPEENQLVFSTMMKNVFEMNFDELSSKTKAEILTMISEKEETQQVGYFELLGHLFYSKFKANGTSDFSDKAKFFYENWQKKSRIFSITITERLRELK